LSGGVNQRACIVSPKVITRKKLVHKTHLKIH
jgi:hypothetical protein